MYLIISWVKKQTTLQLLYNEFVFWNYYFTQMMTTMNKPLTLMGRGSVLEGLEQLLVGFLVFILSFPFFDLILYFFSFLFLFLFFFVGSSSITFTIQPRSQGILTFSFYVQLSLLLSLALSLSLSLSLLFLLLLLLLLPTPLFNKSYLSHISYQKIPSQNQHKRP